MPDNEKHYTIVCIISTSSDSDNYVWRQPVRVIVQCLVIAGTYIYLIVPEMEVDLINICTHCDKTLNCYVVTTKN